MAAYKQAKIKLDSAHRRRAGATYTRYAVASNVVRAVGAELRQPLALDPAEFEKHYAGRPRVGRCQ